MATLSMSAPSLPTPVWKSSERRFGRVTHQCNGVTYGLDWNDGVEALEPRWVAGFIAAVQRVAYVEYVRQHSGMSYVSVEHIAACAGRVAVILGALDVPPPDVLIGPGGTVQFDWTEGGFEIEINFFSDGQSAAYVHALEDPSLEWEGPLDEGQGVLRNALITLAS